MLVPTVCLGLDWGSVDSAEACPLDFRATLVLDGLRYVCASHMNKVFVYNDQQRLKSN